MQFKSGKTQADFDLEVKKAGALIYLKETDWYIVRFQETSKVVPQEVLDKRAEARQLI